MKRVDQNFIVDLISFTAFIGLTLTGIVMHYLLPAGSHSKMLLGWGRHDWGDLHFWMAVFFLATLVLHLLLHWKWIVAAISRRKSEGSGKRVALGIVGLLSLLLLALLLLTPVEEKRGGEGRHYDRGGRQQPVPQLPVR